MITKRIYLGRDKEDSQRLRATALGYDPEKDAAPHVLATGRRLIAKQIIEIAQANHIPLREDPILAGALSTLDVSQEIPPELYAVVAEIFAYIFRVRQKHLEK